MLRILWRIWGRLWIGSDLEKTCPAGRASCAEGGHFVAGIPVEEGRFFVVRPLVGCEYRAGQSMRECDTCISIGYDAEEAGCLD
jgi:hypothetical protein